MPVWKYLIGISLFHLLYAEISVMGVQKLLSFCQIDPPIGESFWQKDSSITHILFELCLFWYLAQGQILGIALYFFFISGCNYILAKVRSNSCKNLKDQCQKLSFVIDKLHFWKTNQISLLYHFFFSGFKDR